MKSGEMEQQPGEVQRQLAAQNEQIAGLMAAMQQTRSEAAEAMARAARAEQERADAMKIAAKALENPGGDVVDGRGVGQPFKLASTKDDFAEWVHKTQTFLVAKMGADLSAALSWSQKQVQSIVADAVAGPREVSMLSMGDTDGAAK